MKAKYNTLLNIEKIREDFPILSKKIRGKTLVYLDNGATSQKPKIVIDRISKYYTEENSNVHRGNHYLSQLATTEMENARKKIAEYINAGSTEEVIFTKGTTESINLVAHSFGNSFISKDDEIIISEMEHHANIVPWQVLTSITGAVLKVVEINNDGTFNMESYKSLLSSKTKLVAVAHTSNVTGIVNPIEEIIRLAHELNIAVLIDGAQAVPHSPINVKELDCEFFVFSGHKMYAPMGVGVLYGKKDILEEMIPYQTGGEMIKEVSFERTSFNDLPFKFEAGTPMVAEILGLSTAIEYMENIGLKNISLYEYELLKYATEKIKEIPGVKIIGDVENKVGVLSFNINNIHPYDLGSILDQFGIAVRTGHHCAQPFMNKMNIQGTVRASFSFYNTYEEIDIFVEALKKAQLMLS